MVNFFWIEVKEKGEWFPIGDVTLSQDNFPIVIGNPTYQHRGIGKKVLSILIELARVKGWKELKRQGNLHLHHSF